MNLNFNSIANLFRTKKKFVPTKTSKWRYAPDGVTKVPVED